jgi:3-hydroxy-5-phosphonooxypentane-2,4-dione thiolase
MDWGMKNRFSKIINPENRRCVMLAVDHGYFLGPTDGLRVPRRTIRPLLPYADSLMVTRGVLRTSVSPDINTPIVLRASGGTSIVGEDLSNESIVTSMEDAIRLNVACLALSIFVGSKYENQSLHNLSRLVDMGEKYGMPVLAVTAVGKEMDRDSRYLGLACRIAAEIGAHIVKTYYCNNFEEIVAGGKKLAHESEALQLAYDALRDGASGVDMGRNIWQSSHPVSMIRAVRSIVHSNVSVEEAHEEFMKNSVMEARKEGPIESK